MPGIDSTEIIFIFNPNSGRRRIERVKRSLAKIDSRISSVVTASPEHLREFFSSNLETFKVFVVVGGDGSVHEAVKYLEGANDKLLAVFPLGSGNGFARELGFKSDLGRLIKEVREGRFVPVDLIAVNNSLSANCSGTGLDAYVAHEFSKTRKRGFVNYIFKAFKSIFVFKSFGARIVINGEQIVGKFRMITITNTGQFGNGAVIAPCADPGDGMIDIVLVKPFPFFLYPVYTYRMFRRTLTPSKYTGFYQTDRSVSLESECEKFHIDGEPVTFKCKVEISIVKGGIRVISTS